jgi:hypothetical protein
MTLGGGSFAHAWAATRRSRAQVPERRLRLPIEIMMGQSGRQYRASRERGTTPHGELTLESGQAAFAAFL